MMYKKSILFLLSFLLLFLHQKQPPFDYFGLALQWPNSFCRLNPCGINPIPEDFKIHGLWPDNYTANPEFCNNRIPIFDDSIVIGGLKEELEEQWPDLKNPNPGELSLVNKEWLKHGLCAYPFYDQNKYLWKALELKLNDDVLQYLKDDGIFPSNTHKVRVSRIRAAIIKKIGVNPIIKCRDSGSGSGSRRYLTEILLCYDPFGVSRKDCPNKGRGCGLRNEVIFPRTP